MLYENSISWTIPVPEGFKTFASNTIHNANSLALIPSSENAIMQKGCIQLLQKIIAQWLHKAFEMQLIDSWSSMWTMTIANSPVTNFGVVHETQRISSSRSTREIVWTCYGLYQAYCFCTEKKVANIFVPIPMTPTNQLEWPDAPAEDRVETSPWKNWKGRTVISCVSGWGSSLR